MIKKIQINIHGFVNFFLHRFCSECKLKVLEAYDLLMDNTEYKYQDKKGFCSSLYDGKITDC
jgi:hypothetical protein